MKPIVLLKELFSKTRALLRDPGFCNVLAWCLPALLLGLILRAALFIRMPDAFFHPDSDQVFDTYRLLQQGSFGVHEKKTVLGPLLYCLPPLVGLPMLPTISLVQHLIGLGMVGMVGFVVANSFRFWRWLIVPVTLLAALHPDLLWYEHVCLPETFYIASIVATALTGLLFARQPNGWRLAALAGSLFLTAGFRPEGKLFFAFGLVLVAGTAWRNWSRCWRMTTAMAAVALLSFILFRTHQSGSLLASNVAHLTPSKLYSAPGFAEQHQDYFNDLRARWNVVPTRIPVERRKLTVFVRDYLAGGKSAKDVPDKQVEKLCGKIGREICLRNIHLLPGLGVEKFRYALNNFAADDFGNDWIYGKQLEALAGDVEDGDKLAHPKSTAVAFARIAYGQEITSRAALREIFGKRYHPFDPDWLTSYQYRFTHAILAWRMADWKFRDSEGNDKVPGLPYLYLLAAAGLLTLALRGRKLRLYHFAWWGMLALLALALSLTGSNLGRFRIAFEPFWFLYAFALFDVAAGLLIKQHDPSDESHFEPLNAGLAPKHLASQA